MCIKEQEISAERLDKIISETERYIAARPHKSRHNASTEVNAALFLSILNELKERRQDTQKSIEAQRLSLSYTADLENQLEDALEELKRLAVIMTGSDAPGEIRALTVTARSLVQRCKALAAEASDLIPLLEILKPEYGAPGSRDVDVTAKRDAVDALIKIFRLGL